MQTRRIGILCSLFATIVACSSEPEPETCLVKGHAKTAPVCATTPALDSILDLVDRTEGTQIHIDSTFVDGKVWLTYNVFGDEGDGKGDIFMSYLECDGTLGPSMRVNTTTNVNDTDASIVANDNALFISWTGDKGGTPANNLDIYYQLLSFNGSSLIGNDRVADRPYLGQPIDRSMWMTRAATMPNGQFAFSGVRVLPEFNGFQVFGQIVNASGDFVGDAIDSFNSIDEVHYHSAIGSDGDGNLRLAWQRANVTNTSLSYVSSTSAFTPGNVAKAFPLDISGGNISDAPQFSKAQQDAPQYLVFHDTTTEEIVLVDPSRPIDTQKIATFHTPGLRGIFPAVAAAPWGGAVAYHQDIPGSEVNVVIQPFTYDCDEISKGDPIVLTQTALPYGPTISYVGDNTFFVGWTETLAANDRRAKGQFLRF